MPKREVDCAAGAAEVVEPKFPNNDVGWVLVVAPIVAVEGNPVPMDGNPDGADGADPNSDDVGCWEGCPNKPPD